MNEETTAIPAVGGGVPDAPQTPELSMTPAQPSVSLSMWNDMGLMKTAYKTAQLLSQSTIIPESYRGKPGDCLILLDLCDRMGLSPISIAQYSQVVKGNFTWKGQACKAFVDGCGRYIKSQYVMVGEPGAMSWGCFLRAWEKTGEVVDGPTVTLQTAADEGWLQKNGSKWKTMPELMLKYRAAAFFARTECPNLLMGFQTVDEVQDVKGWEPDEPETVRVTLTSGVSSPCHPERSKAESKDLGTAADKEGETQ